MRFSLIQHLVIIVFLLTNLTACSPLRTPKPEALSIVNDLPSQFNQNQINNTNSLKQYQPAQWWLVFEDPILDQILSKAISGNLDLVESAARLSAAKAEAYIAKSSRFPQLSLNTDARHTETSADRKSEQSNELDIETYTSSLEFSYEVDLWNKLRNLNKAKKADAFAAEWDLKAMHLTVISETIEAYFELINTRTQLALLKKATALLKERTQQTETRYSKGLVSSFELYRIRQEFRNTQAIVPQNEAQIVEIEGRLATLSGDYLHKLQALLKSELTPKLAFNDISPNLPASLLIDRPDVFAASQRMKASRHIASARRAELFPSINFTGQFGKESDDYQRVFNTIDDWILSLGAQLTAPLFQGGRIRANIAVADAEYAQASAAYARTVINAFQEVNTAIANYNAQRNRYRFIFKQWQQAKHSTNLQSQRYQHGLAEYFDYLDALIQQYQVESELSISAKDVALAYLATHRALGGNWVSEPISQDLNHNSLHHNSENILSGDK